MAHVIVTIYVVIIRKMLTAIAVLTQLTIHRNAWMPLNALMRLEAWMTSDAWTENTEPVLSCKLKELVN